MSRRAWLLTSLRAGSSSWPSCRRPQLARSSASTCEPWPRGALLRPDPLDMPFADVGGARLEYEWIRTGAARRPAIVLLHEGLGSISMWRDFPRRLAETTHREVLVYS